MGLNFYPSEYAQHMHDLYYDYQLTIDRILMHASRVYGEQEVVYHPPGGRRVAVTFKELEGRVRRIASALSSMGLRVGSPGEMGSRVAVLEWNTLRYLDLYYAVPSSGYVLYTVNLRLAPAEILYTMKVAQPEVLFINVDDFAQYVKPIVDNVGSIKHVVLMSDKDEVPRLDLGNVKVTLYDDLLKEGDPNFDFPQLNERTVATMMFTSGTTGLPKGVYHTHRNIVLHSLAGGLTFQSPPLRVSMDDVALILVPMFHVHAWGLPYLLPLGGLKMVYPGRFDWDHILGLFKSEGITYFAGVPTILYIILTHPKSREVDLSGVKVVIGGSALPRGLLMEAKRRGMNVTQGYGLTETCPLLTIAGFKPGYRGLREEELDELRLMTGLPAALVDLRVVDENDRDVPRDGKTIGEIVVRAPWLAPEYYGDPEKTRNAWRNRWFHTGDAAVWFENGYIRIVDRIKDVIKSGGEWIPSLRLEDIISTHPGVSMVAVIGVPHEKWGERPVAVITPKPEYRGRLSEEDIRNHLMRFVEKGEVPKWWVPDKVIIIDQEQVPLTSTGKIDKKILRERFKDVLRQ